MANPELTRKALEKATPAQLLRVRGLLTCRPQTRGFIIMDNYNREALDAFDKGRYDDPKIANVLYDHELAEALR